MSVKLHHADLGGTDNPPLIVLHGLLGSSRNWVTTGRDLASAWHVFVLDARNHGKSPHDPIMDYEAMVDDVAHWMSLQGLARATLMGHSMGGKVAMLLACRQPALVERLVVVDIAPKDYFWVAHRSEFTAMNELSLGSLTSRQEAEMRFEARVANPGMRKFLATNLDRDSANDWRWLINLPVLTRALPDIEKNSLQPEDHYTGPTLFVGGEKSPYIKTEDHEMIRRHFPAARLEIIDGSGHNPHMDAREEFVRLVTSMAAR